MSLSNSTTNFSYVNSSLRQASKAFDFILMLHKKHTCEVSSSGFVFITHQKLREEQAHVKQLQIVVLSCLNQNIDIIE